MRLPYVFLLLLPPVLSNWDNGYFFPGGDSFAELPARALCDNLNFRMDFFPQNNDAILFVAYNSRLRTMLMVQASKPIFNLTIVDNRRSEASRRKLDSIITLPYMFSDWANLHEIEVKRVSAGRLIFRVDRITKTVFLHGTAPPFPIEQIRYTRLFLSRPKPEAISVDDHWVFKYMKQQNYKGYVRNAIGQRDCDCAQERRLNLVGSVGLTIDNLEPCEKQNPCQVGCLCVSGASEPECVCKNTIRCPDFAPFVHSLPMDHMLGKRVINKAGLTARASGEVELNDEHAVRDKAVRMGLPGAEIRISEPPDFRSCFSHLSKCDRGLTISLWLRLENPTLHRPNTILRTTSRAPCSYGLSMTHSITDGLRLIYKTQLGDGYMMVSPDLLAEQWIHVVVQIPDTIKPFIQLLINGRLQTDRNAVQLNSTRKPGEMIKCRSDVLILGNVTAEKKHGPDGVHFLMIDSLEMVSPMVPRSHLAKFDLYHYVMASAGTYGEVYQLQALTPRVHTYTFTTKGVAKVAEDARQNSLVLSPVTDGVLTMSPRLTGSDSALCLFNFESCLNGIYLSVWLKVGTAAMQAEDVRLFQWNDLKFRLRKGKPSLFLKIAKDSWSITDVNQTVPSHRWIFVEASWDRHNGLKIFVDRASQGKAVHNYDPNANVSTSIQGATLILGANVKFQMDDLQLRTAGRKALIQMERVSLVNPESLQLDFNAITAGKVLSNTKKRGAVVGALKLVLAKIRKGIEFRDVKAPAFINMGYSFNHFCIGNLNHCPNGLYISFWLKTDALTTSGSTLLTTGYSGVTITWKDAGHLSVEARTLLRVWKVQMKKPMSAGRFHYVEVSWDKRLGLRIFCDLRLMNVDVMPTLRVFTKQDIYNQKQDRVLIGYWKAPFPKAGAIVLDEVEIWAANREFLSNWKHVALQVKSNLLLNKKPKSKVENVTATTEKSAKALDIKMMMPPAKESLVFPQFAMLPFEWSFPNGRIPNTRFDVRLHGNATLFTYGSVGSALALSSATKDYVTLGEHYGCFGNLDACPSGLTIRFWLWPKKEASRRAVVLASRSYEIFIGTGQKLNFIFKALGQVWVSQTYRVDTRWQFVEVSWSVRDGLRVYVDSFKTDIVASGIETDQRPLRDDPTIYIGRPGAFCDVLMDELEMWQSPIDFLMEHDFVYASKKHYRFSMSGDDKRVLVSGKPKQVVGVREFGLQLPGRLDLGTGVICKEDDLSFCPNGLTIRMWLRLDAESARSSGLLTAGTALNLTLTKGRMKAQLWSHGLEWTTESTETLKTEIWYLIELSWQRDSGLLLLLNARTIASDHQPKKEVLKRREMGSLVVGDGRANMTVDEVEVWNSKLALVILRGQIDRKKDKKHLFNSEIQSDAGHEGEIEYLRFVGNNYMRYNFTGMPYEKSELDILKIEFSVTKPDGLLWLGRDNKTVNMLFLVDGKIHLRIMHMRPTGEINSHDFRMKKQAVNDGKKHTVEMVRTARTTLLMADGDKKNDRLAIKTRNKIHLRPRDRVFLGGMPNSKTFGVSDLVGNIYKARVEFDYGRSVDLLRDINRIPHESSNGPKVYKLKPRPSPAPKSVDMSDIDKNLRGILTPNKIPYTFYTSGARLYMNSWSFPTMKSIEFEFITFEPQGLIFFIGAGMHAKSFVAIEIFDSELYSVYSAGGSGIRTKLDKYPVDGGHKHRVKLTVYPEGYIEVIMNGVNVKIPKEKNAEAFDFDSYTYVGGVDVYNKKNTRLPWQVWSRSGFIGCMNYIKFNDKGYYDARGYQAQHAFPERDIGKCIVPAFTFCNHPSDCGHGVCYKRWRNWKDKRNFFCDCSMTGYTHAAMTDPTMMQHEVRGQKCTKPSSILKGDGRSGRTVVFTHHILSTHTDHVTLEFQTRRPNGGLFMTSVPASPTFLKVQLVNGRVFVTTNVYRTLRSPNEETYRVGQGVYDDGKWHKLTYLRRANYTTFWMDTEPKQNRKLPYSPSAYYFIAKHIIMGTFNNTMPGFHGKLRNFYWNAYDFINYPVQRDVYRTEYIEGPKPKSSIPLEPPVMKITNPVTVKNGTNFLLTYRKFEYDPIQGASAEIVFRTDEADVMIVHMHNDDHFISFELLKGTPQYSFDAGNGKFSPYLPKEWRNLHDQTWHQLFISITPEEDGRRHRLWLDGKLANIGKFSHIPKPLHVYLGGVPKVERSKRDAVHTAVKKAPKFLGCFGKGMISGKFALNKTSVQVSPPHRKTVLFGKCIDPKHCSVGYCRNGGECVSLDWDKIACKCNAMYEGPNCERERPKPKCPPNFCKNGACVMTFQVKSSNSTSNKTGWVPKCDCGTAYSGPRCEKENRCPLNHCYNFGVCYMKIDNKPRCNCSMTGYTGPRCREKSPGIRLLYKKWGYVVMPARRPYKRNLDSIAFGFQTYMPNGHLTTFMMENGQFWEVFMRDRALYLRIGKNREYRIKGPLNDGNYHILSMVRNMGTMDISLDGKSIRRAIFTDLAKEPDYAMTYSQVIIGANASYQNIFRGTVGGFYWNGFYILDKLIATRNRGTVEITLTPTFLSRPETKDCPKDMCKNCGRCYRDRDVVRCDCYRTGYGGNFCEKPIHFGVWSTGVQLGSTVMTVTNHRACFNSDLRFGFQTFNDTGPLVCMVGRSGKYWKIFLRDGLLVLNVNGKDEFFNVGNERMPLNDGKLKVVTVERKGSTYMVQVGGCGKRTIHYSDGATTMNQIEVMTIFVGSDCTKVGQKFDGVIGAFRWLGRGMIHSGGGYMSYVRQIGRSRIVELPFDFSLRKEGSAIWNPKSGTPGPPAGPKKPKPTPKPAVGMLEKPPVLIPIAAAGGGGVIGWAPAPLLIGLLLALLLLLVALMWGCIFCKPGCCCSWCPGAVAAKKLRFSHPYSQFEKNGGLSSVPLIRSNGFQSAPPPISDIPKSSVDPFQSAPPMESAPPPMEDIGKQQVGAFESAPPLDDDDIDVVDRATLDNRQTMTLTKAHSEVAQEAESQVHNIHHVHHIHHWTDGNEAAGGAHEDEVSYRSLSHSNYHQHASLGYHDRLDIGFDMHESHADMLDAEHQLTEENAFSGELRVNCCQLSRNSRYAVTGAGSAAPEVWNLNSGSLIKVLDGAGFGCSGLHLACKDAVLVGQVHDDSAPWPPLLHAWDFVSGRQIELGKDLVCTALCVTHVGHHVVVARFVPGHEHNFSLLVWDLMTNREIHETHFMPPSGLSPDTGITFLKISLDDRFVVAGYANHFDQHANYLVFDLTLAYAPGTVINPHVVVFDAHVDCTEMLANNEEAVTGTRLGELSIWDLNSGRTVRQIVNGSPMDRFTSTVIPAHSGAVHALAISTDGKLLASAAGDHLVRSWDMTDEKLQHTMKGHESDVLSVAISEDKELAVSGSDDGSIRVWRLDRDGSQLCWFTSNIAVFHVKLSPNKEVLVALGERSMVRKLIMLRIVRNKEKRKKTANQLGTTPHPTA